MDERRTRMREGTMKANENETKLNEYERECDENEMKVKSSHSNSVSMLLFRTIRDVTA